MHQDKIKRPAKHLSTRPYRWSPRLFLAGLFCAGIFTSASSASAAATATATASFLGREACFAMSGDGSAVTRVLGPDFPVIDLMGSQAGTHAPGERHPRNEGDVEAEVTAEQGRLRSVVRLMWAGEERTVFSSQMHVSDDGSVLFCYHASLTVPYAACPGGRGLSLSTWERKFLRSDLSAAGELKLSPKALAEAGERVGEAYLCPGKLEAIVGEPQRPQSIEPPPPLPISAVPYAPPHDPG